MEGINIMAWQNWDTIDSGIIIKKTHLDKIQDNLQWLSTTGIQINNSTGRCIGFYQTICSTDNGTVYAPNCPRYGSGSAGNSGNCGSDYGTVNSAQGTTGGLQRNTRTNNFEGFNSST